MAKEVSTAVGAMEGGEYGGQPIVSMSHDNGGRTAAQDVLAVEAA